MTTFQIILVATLSLLALALVVLAARGAVGRLVAALGLAILGAGIVFSIEPDWTTAIAHTVGIRRGADLLLYLLVLFVLQGFLLMYLKLRRVRRELTLLVREIAIREASRAEPQKPDAAGERDAPAGRS